MENSRAATKPRYLTEIDLLKFIAIVGMVIIHIYENWTGFDPAPYADTPVDIFIQFLGGPVCAPLFMIACGIGVIYTRSTRPVDYLNRGLILIVTAYLLNFLRSGLLYTLAEGPNAEFTLRTMLNVDILHLAGLSFILIGIMRALRCNKWHVLILAIIMFAVSETVGAMDVDGFSGYVFGLFVFTESVDVCFPLFGWFIFIAVGVFLGSCLKNSGDHVRLYKSLFALGAILFVAITAGALVAGEYLFDYFALYDDWYYRQTFAALGWTLGIVFMCIAGAYFLMDRYSNERFDRVCHFYGKNLNRIYIMQWIIIANVGMVLDAMETCVDPVMAIPLGILLLAGVSLLVPTYIKGTEFLRAKFSENTGTF